MNKSSWSPSGRRCVSGESSEGGRGYERADWQAAEAANDVHFRQLRRIDDACVQFTSGSQALKIVEDMRTFASVAANQRNKSSLLAETAQPKLPPLAMSRMMMMMSMIADGPTAVKWHSKMKKNKLKYGSRFESEN